MGFANALELLQSYATELIVLEADLATLQARLAEKKERFDALATEKMPELLDELGFKDLRLSDGRRLEMEEKVAASIPTESGISRMKSSDQQRAASIRRKAALAWLREHGLGDLIKNEITVPFSRGQEDQATELFNELEGKGFPAEREEAVNTNTLSAQVRELMANGEDVPLELLGVTVIRSVSIK